MALSKTCIIDLDCIKSAVSLILLMKINSKFRLGYFSEKLFNQKQGSCIRRDRAEKEGTKKMGSTVDQPGKAFILHGIK